jgi:hypothetical protein
MKDYWNIGKIKLIQNTFSNAFHALQLTSPSFHYSITPILQHSIIPKFTSPIFLSPKEPS